MNELPPRLRMFSGPNGSGKTTIKNGLGRSESWFGIYINPDDLEKSIRETGKVSIANTGLHIETSEIRQFFASSEFLRKHGLQDVADAIQINAGHIEFGNPEINSYHTSVLADFLRRKALDASLSFSLETVMSSPDKISLLKEARQRGYRTYLYYVATRDPEINIARVKYRVAEGGHDVPEDKIRSRYFRSLNLLPEAIEFANRAYFFDTSEEIPLFFAETTDGLGIQLHSPNIPAWFQGIWESFERGEAD